jgi:uncharacterized protein YdeI (YjbR/CyaY-like superfamily)
MAARLSGKNFQAVLTRSGNSLNWVIIRLPFDVQHSWKVRGQFRVKGTVNDFPFKSTLFPTGDGHHYMIVNKQMQKGGRVQPGMEAHFFMEPDLEERPVPVSPELEHALKQSRRLQKFFQSLTPYTRKEAARLVTEAKSAESRSRKANQVAEWLMETMEAELDLPPIIRQALARNPKAAESWKKMAASHRRRHLMGIFYYRNPDSRARRIEKAVAEMLKHSKQD